VHGRLLDLDLDDLGRVLDHLADVGLESAADLSVNALEQVAAHAGHTPLPRVGDAGSLKIHTSTIMTRPIPFFFSSLVYGKTTVGLDEAARTMREQQRKEEDEEVVRVPKDLKVLSADVLHRGRVHDEHDDDEQVACRARHGSKRDRVGRGCGREVGRNQRGRVGVADGVKVEVVRADVQQREEQDGPRDRLVERNVFVEWDLEKNEYFLPRKARVQSG